MIPIDPPAVLEKEKLPKFIKENYNFLLNWKFSPCWTQQSSPETTETKQADSQLHFAPKIIKIHSLAFENDSIEDAVLVRKKTPKLKTRSLVMDERIYPWICYILE